jgi:hypothetical protein
MRLRSLEGNDQAFDLRGQVVGIVGDSVQYGDQLTIEIQTYVTTMQVLITVRNCGPAIPDG